MLVAVVGAGIAGLTAAYNLARAGHDVTVYDREPYAARQCSYANGGQISVSNSETWNTWANVHKGMKWLLKKDAPLLIRPSLDPEKAVWLLKFLYHTANNDYYKNTLATIKLGLESRILLDRIAREENIDYHELKKGILHIYSNEKYFKHVYKAKKIYDEGGVDWEIIDNPQHIIELEPALEKKKDIIGAVYTSSDWSGDIHLFCKRLTEVLTTKYNVDFEYNHLVGVKHLDHYDRVVISGGVGSNYFAKELGDHIGVYPVKGYSITVELEDLESSAYAPTISLLDDEAKIVSSRFRHSLRIAGTAELAGENYDIRRDRIEPLLKWLHKNFPNVKTDNYRSWACLRPMTPNMMPVVRRSRNPKYYYHTGHGHLGWTLSAATAQQLTKLIQEDL